MAPFRAWLFRTYVRSLVSFWGFDSHARLNQARIPARSATNEETGNMFLGLGLGIKLGPIQGPDRICRGFVQVLHMLSRRQQGCLLSRFSRSEWGFALYTNSAVWGQQGGNIRNHANLYRGLWILGLVVRDYALPCKVQVMPYLCSGVRATHS